MKVEFPSEFFSLSSGRTDLVFWLPRHLGSYILVRVLNTGATLTTISLKAVQKFGVTIC